MHFFFLESWTATGQPYFQLWINGLVWWLSTYQSCCQREGRFFRWSFVKLWVVQYGRSWKMMILIHFQEVKSECGPRSITLALCILKVPLMKYYICENWLGMFFQSGKKLCWSIDKNTIFGQATPDHFDFRVINFHDFLQSVIAIWLIFMNADCKRSKSFHLQK